MSITWQHYRDWLQDLLSLPTGLSAPHPNAISTDTRTLQRGQWFFALPGEHYDGHEHIDTALQKGACGFFADQRYREKLSPATAARGIWIAAGQQLSALCALARGYRRSLVDTRIVAITGSVGKTTTKELLRSMLQQRQRVTASPANHNNEIGVAQTIMSIVSDDDSAIIECGARQRGDLALLADIIAPDIALFTNIGSAHVGIFGSPQALLHGKLELLRHSPRNCLGVVNADCKTLLAAARKSGHRLLTFGISAADVHVEQVTYSKRYQHVQLNTTGGKFSIRSAERHSAMPINIAAAASVCLALGISTADIQAGSEVFCNAPSRFQTISRGDLTIIDDSYNASPESVRCGLESLRRSWSEQRWVLVLGDMVELGEGSVGAHRQIATLVQDMQPALLVTVGELARHIARAAPQLRSMSFEDVDEFLQKKINLTQYGNLVYLKASRQVDLTRIVATLN